MRRDDSIPEAYRSAVDGEQSEILESIRQVIRETCPDIREEIRSLLADVLRTRREDGGGEKQ